MRGFHNAARLQALRTAGLAETCRTGQVTGYDPDTYSVKVTIPDVPNDLQTGWIPLAAHWVGDGWGFYAPPSTGDPVSVIFIEGELTAGFAECRFFNSALRPLRVPSGELWLVHKSGAFFKLTNDGKLTHSDGQGATLTFNGDGTITVAGPVTFTDNATFEKDVQVNQTLTADTDVVGGGKSLKTHVHTAVQTGSGTSGPPQ